MTCPIPGRIPDAVVDQVRAVPGVARAAGLPPDEQRQFVDADGERRRRGRAAHLRGLVGRRRAVPPHGRAPARRARVRWRWTPGPPPSTGSRSATRSGCCSAERPKGPRSSGSSDSVTRDDFGAVTFAAFDLATAQREFDAGDSVDCVYVQREPGVHHRRPAASASRPPLGPGYVVANTDGGASGASAGRCGSSSGSSPTRCSGSLPSAWWSARSSSSTPSRSSWPSGPGSSGCSGRWARPGGQVVRSVVLEALRRGCGGVGDRACARASASGSGLLRTAPRARARAPGDVDRRARPARSWSRWSSASWSPSSPPPSPPIRGCARSRRSPRSPTCPPRAVGGFGRRVVAGLVVLAAGILASSYGLARARDVSGVFEQVQVVALGAFAVLVGVVLLLPAVVRPAVRAIGAPLRRLGPPGTLARANAMRNPRRTAITASALVIGLALVGLTATFGASARASVGREHRRRPAGRLHREDRRLRRASRPRWSARLRDQPGCHHGGADALRRRRGRRRHEDGRQHRPGIPGRRSSTSVSCSGGPSGARRGRRARRATSSPVTLGVDTGDQLAVQFSQGQLPADRARRSTGSQNFIGLFGQSVPLLVSPGTIDGSAPAARRRTRWCCCRTEGGEDAATQRALSAARSPTTSRTSTC